ncbi:hypothetical protein HYV49_02770 [Candidatus Pacearchaeota archaeon]|nr:hypothetical protein [Candidatus Pacearchaeota archaeon]
MSNPIDVKANLESLFQELINERDYIARMQRASDFTELCLSLIDNPDYRTIAQEYMRRYVKLA